MTHLTGMDCRRLAIALIFCASVATSFAQTPDTPVPAASDQKTEPQVSVSIYALGDAPVRQYIRLKGEKLQEAMRVQKESWEQTFPGKPFPGSNEPIVDTEPVNPLEVPPSPILVDLDKSKKTRKFLNLDHMGRARFVMTRSRQLSLQRVFDQPSGPPKTSPLIDIPIPPAAEDLLVFIIKPPNTYEWTQSTFQTFDVSQKHFPQNSLLIINLSLFTVRAAILSKSPDNPAEPVSIELKPGAITSKITRDPTGEKIALFYEGEVADPFASKINTPREKGREVIVIYNKMSGDRTNLQSTPGMQSFTLPTQ